MFATPSPPATVQPSRGHAVRGGVCCVLQPQVHAKKPWHCEIGLTIHTKGSTTGSALKTGKSTLCVDQAHTCRAVGDIMRAPIAARVLPPNVSSMLAAAVIWIARGSAGTPWVAAATMVPTQRRAALTQPSLTAGTTTTATANAAKAATRALVSATKTRAQNQQQHR